MADKQVRRWFVEILFWIVTVVVAGLFLLPIVNGGVDFPFLIYNFIFIVLGLTIARYVLFWRVHPMYESIAFKVAMIFLVPIIIFPIIEGFHSFVEYTDQIGLQELVAHMEYGRQRSMIDYIKGEYLTFAVMTFAGGFLLIIKMLRELFRQYKYGINR